MLDKLFGSLIESNSTSSFSLGSFLICTVVSIVLGAVIAAVYSYRNRQSKSMLLTLVILPAVVQTVIMLVNGNLGAGVAVAGAFSLVRFRSAPGSAREICSIFLAMAAGLATGMGYIAYAVLFVIIIGGVSLLFAKLSIAQAETSERELKLTIPESLDYTGVFEPLLAEYASSYELVHTKTTNMGSLFKLTYRVRLKPQTNEKAFIDSLRTKNGNLEISLARPSEGKEEL